MRVVAKLSNSLTALSSAAILAVYAVGYHRTSAAADRFAAEGHREQPEPSIAANFVAPAQALPSFKTTLATPTTSTTKPAANIETAAKPEAPPSTTTASDEASSAAPVLTPAEIVVPPPVAPSIVMPSTIQVLNQPTAEVLPPPPPPLPPAESLKDGTYNAWGSCRHGDIEASVVIEGGKIASAAISQCYTRYPCTWIANAPGQVVARQSIKVDYVSGATQSIDAFKQAVAGALANAR
jgi:uncharacterized protein with FMN-binding domain